MDHWIPMAVNGTFGSVMSFDLSDEWTTVCVDYTGENTVLQHYAMILHRFT
jgi:hypothetical protein